MKITYSLASKLSLIFIILSILIPNTGYSQNAKIDKLIKEFSQLMAKKHQFNANKVTQLLKQAKKKPKILEAIKRPAEGKPWHIYRSLFINDERVLKGVQFWNMYEKSLFKAEQIYGVAPEIILGIIGVETRFGLQKGGYRVLDALYTLGFHYPKRGGYFRTELAHFLIMAKKEKLNPLKVLGSYAGAIGWPQFMPSSYRRFAVDFDGNGKRDLLKSVDDSIGSVAFYLKKHGWRKGQAIAIPVKVNGKSYQNVLKWGIKPKKSIKQLKQYGIRPMSAASNDLLAALFGLEYKKGKDYWLALKNFYVITRYNRSTHYAMAVTQLGQEVKQKRVSLMVKKKQMAKKKHK